MLQTATRLEHKVRSAILRLAGKKFFIKFYSSVRPLYLWLLRLYAKLFLTALESTHFPQTVFKSELSFRNDLAAAAGFDKDGSLLEFNYKLGSGFAIVGTTLLRAHQGNRTAGFLGQQVNAWVPLVRSNAAVNSLGLPNKGIHSALKNIRHFRAKFKPEQYPIFLSVMGHPHSTPEERATEVLEMLTLGAADADGFEINESCPNVGLHSEHETTAEFLQRVESIINWRQQHLIQTGKYLVIALKFRSLLGAAELLQQLDYLGVDAVSVANTQTNYKELAAKVHPAEQDLFLHYTKTFSGGVSGAVIKDQVLTELKLLDKAIIDHQLRIRLIHIGGIAQQGDIAESRKLKSVVLRQWYTGLLQNMGEQSWQKIYQSVLSAESK